MVASSSSSTSRRDTASKGITEIRMVRPGGAMGVLAAIQRKYCSIRAWWNATIFVLHFILITFSHKHWQRMRLTLLKKQSTAIKLRILASRHSTLSGALRKTSQSFSEISAQTRGPLGKRHIMCVRDDSDRHSADSTSPFLFLTPTSPEKVSS